MERLDLTRAPLFEELLTLDFGAGPEELPDDYACRVLVDDGDGLAFLFRRADGAEISLIFESAVLLESAGRFVPGMRLDAFHRWRYVVGGTSGNDLVETQGARYFYRLDFIYMRAEAGEIDEDFGLTLAAARVTASFTAAPA